MPKAIPPLLVRLPGWMTGSTVVPEFRTGREPITMKHMSSPNLRSVTERERAERAAVNDGQPTLEFAGRVPYDAYVRASTLHSLQHTLSDDPGERSFLVVSQVMELYFGMVRFELREAQRLLREDRDDAVWAALAPLRRAALHLEGLNASWRALRWMTPADFNRFRDLLGEGSGFQSAMYRRMEFALGLKMASLIRPFRRQPSLYTELVEELRAPSLWDEVIALLAGAATRYRTPRPAPTCSPTTNPTRASRRPGRRSTATPGRTTTYGCSARRSVRWPRRSATGATSTSRRSSVRWGRRWAAAAPTASAGCAGRWTGSCSPSSGRPGH